MLRVTGRYDRLVDFGDVLQSYLAKRRIFGNPVECHGFARRRPV